MGKEIITNEDVDAVLSLSRISATEEEKQKIKSNLTQIIDYFNALSDVDTKKVDAFNFRKGLPREDKIEESLGKSEVVKNAPFHTDSVFVVPRVVE